MTLFQKLVAPALTTAAFTASLVVGEGAIAPANAAASGTWTLTGSLNKAREGQTAILLPNGNVLVAGGETNARVTNSAEIYNSANEKWSVTGRMAVARASHQAALLPSGSVLVAGGCVKVCAGRNTTTAELYDPSSGTWSKTGSMATARVYFGLAVLSNGTVLAVGGCTGQNANGCSGVTTAAETYDPLTGKWVATGSLQTARGAFTTTVLPSGRVLVAGGIDASNNPISSAEEYDPSTAKWTATGSMKVARDEQTAILLSSGSVLVAGGEKSSGVSTAKAELYDPSSKSWALTGSMSGDRLEHTAVLLGNGKVLVSGGNKVTANTTTVLSSAELYDPSTGTWTATGSMKAGRVGQSSTLLGSGLVLNAGGGSSSGNEQSSAETYQP